MAGAQQQQVQQQAHRGRLPELSWQDINQPGAYVEVQSGELYRIPQEALLAGSSPLIRKESATATTFMQLSANPYITTHQARLTCAENNVLPQF